MDEEKSSKRKYNSTFRKKLNDKIKKINQKSLNIKIFKIITEDIGDNFSENKSGIYFNLNLLSDDSINKIIEKIEEYETLTVSETTEDKIVYRAYSENETDLYNNLGPRLSNQEKSILKKCKNSTDN